MKDMQTHKIAGTDGSKLSKALSCCMKCYPVPNLMNFLQACAVMDVLGWEGGEPFECPIEDSLDEGRETVRN